MLKWNTWMKQEIPKIFPPTPTSPKPQRPKQCPIRCVPRSRVHCLLVRSSPSPPAVHVPSRSVLISHMFWDEPSSHTHPTAGTEMITLGTMTVWRWRQLFSVSWFACRWRAPESCLEEVCPVHSSTCSSKSKEVRFGTHLEPPVLESSVHCNLTLPKAKACTLKRRGSSCERRFRVLGSAFKSQTRSQWSLDFEDSWKNLTSLVLEQENIFAYSPPQQVEQCFLSLAITPKTAQSSVFPKLTLMKIK